MGSATEQAAGTRSTPAAPMKPEAGWYAVALSGGIEAGTSAGTRLFDHELVVWRDEAGASHVWEDRCPHRGMRLSFGFVRGNHIACLYHGWQYDVSGQCRYIPAHPKLDVPDTIRVPTYPTIEATGMIWAHFGAEGEVTAHPPEHVAATAVRSLYIDLDPAAARFLLESGFAGDFEPAAPNLFVTEAAGERVLAAFQPFGAERTALHIVRVEGEADPRRLAEWAEGLRDRLEAARPAAGGVDFLVAGAAS